MPFCNWTLGRRRKPVSGGTEGRQRPSLLPFGPERGKSFLKRNGTAIDAQEALGDPVLGRRKK